MILILVSLILFNSCRSEEDFDNKIYNVASSKVNNLLIKANIVNEERTLQAAIPKPEKNDISITYKADPSLVDTYNEAYYDNAIILPADFYELPEPTVTIAVGSVRSNETVIRFININQLNRDLVYVLPVTIASADIDILESARTTYFVFKGAALINVVADIEENYLHINEWKNPDVVNSLSEVTIEALIRCRNYDRLISTVMGIEGRFLIRIGDAGFPSNQIQISTSSGNFPDGDSNKGLPTDEWIHIALTYNSFDGAMKLYVNGVEKAISTVNGSQSGAGVTTLSRFDFAEVVNFVRNCPTMFLGYGSFWGSSNVYYDDLMVFDRVLTADDVTALHVAENSGHNFTGIDEVTTTRKSTDSSVYNLNGQRVGTSVDGLPRGIYIRQGKKFIVR